MSKIIYDLDNNTFTDKLTNTTYHFKKFKENLSIKKILFYFFKKKETEIICKYPPSDIKNVSVRILLFLSIISKANLKINNKNTDYIQYNFMTLLFKWFFLNLFKGKLLDYFFFLLIKKKLKKKNIPKINKSNKNILYTLIENSNFKQHYGGKSAHISGIINELAKKFNKVYFITNQKVNFENKNIIIFNLKKSYFFGDSLFARYLISLDYLKDIIILIKKQNLINISAIYGRFGLTNFVSNFLSAKISKPLITEYNGSESWIAKYWNEQDINYKLERKLETTMLENSSIISVVSSPLVSELNQRLKNKNICLVPNGVNFKELKNIKKNIILRDKLKWQDKTIVCFSGSYGPWHGAELLAKAFKHIDETNPDTNIRLLFIGSGANLLNCKNILKNVSPNKYHFYGTCLYNENISLLKDCDILVSPQVNNIDGSKFFGSPTKIFEYMALEKIVIVSDVGDIPKYVKNNIDGLIFKNNDYKDLSDKILNTYNNYEKMKNMKILSSIKAEKEFDWSIRVDVLVKFINQKL